MASTGLTYQVKSIPPENRILDAGEDVGGGAAATL
jgi:hypothetical protein